MEEVILLRSIGWSLQGRAVVALADIGKEFERNLLDIFVGFFGGRRDTRDVDAESHCTLDLGSVGVVAAFYWSFQEVPQWVVCDMNRPSVPV